MQHGLAHGLRGDGAGVDAHAADHRARLDHRNAFFHLGCGDCRPLPGRPGADDGQVVFDSAHAIVSPGVESPCWPRRMAQQTADVPLPEATIARGSPVKRQGVNSARRRYRDSNEVRTGQSAGVMLAGQLPLLYFLYSESAMIRLRVVILCAFAAASAAISCLAADRILFDRLGPTGAGLFISNADGSDERALTQPGSLDYNPSWSLKGDWIVFTSERGGSADLFRIHS